MIKFKKNDKITKKLLNFKKNIKFINIIGGGVLTTKILTSTTLND